METKDQKTQRMTIVIGGRSYPVKASAQEALVIPIVEKEINEKIQQMKMSFDEIDIQDCLSMILLSTTLEAHTTTPPTDSTLTQQIDGINSKIEQALQS